MLEMVTGRNFRSYEEVKLEFGHQRVSVVFGESTSDFADSNGTGKTSLMYLVLWTLFGKWPGMENSDSCVRQPVNKDCGGIIKIRKPDGLYIISRYRKHSEHGNNVFIQPPYTGPLAPEPISGDLKVMNERIEGILGMTYETFVRTMVFTGSERENFSLMTDKEQKALLDTIFPVDFSGLLERARAKHKFALETEIECSGVIKAIDNWITKDEQALLELDQKREDIAREHDAEALAHQLGEAELTKSSVIHEIGVIESQRVALRAQIDAARDALTAYRPTMQQFDEAKERLSSFMSAKEMLTRQENERKSRLEWFDQNIAKENARLKHDHGEKTCHTCGQTLGPEALARATHEVQRELKRLGDERLAAIRSYDSIQADYLSRQTRSGFNDETAQTFTTNYTAAAQHSRKLQETHDQLTGQDRGLDDKLRGLRRQQEQLEQRITNLKSLMSTGDHGLDKLDQEEKRLTAELDRLKSDRSQAAANQQQWTDEKALWSNVVDMFSGGKGSLQHFLFENLLPEMTATAQMFLSLFSAQELKVAFKSHRVKGSKTIEGFYIEATKGENTKGYGDLSGGERRRIDFCIFLTLYLMAAKHVFSPGVIFLDEIADFMDDTGQQSIVTSVLDFLCREYGVSCLLLTNKRELVASVAHGYRCSMTEGVSRLVPVQET